MPLTSETKNLINKEFLSRFKKQILFLNGSRGPVANVEDVIEALENNKIVAAAFDVLPKEKFPVLYDRSEEHTSELQSLMRISYAVFCLTKKNTNRQNKR